MKSSRACRRLVSARIASPKLFLLPLLCLPAASAIAAPADTDPTFGVAGITTFCAGDHGCFTQPNDMTVQADGRILMAGSTPHGTGGSDWLFARLNSDGSLDTTFNSTGWLDVSVGPGIPKESGAAKAVVRSDGSILGVGWANDLATGGAYRDVEMLALNGDGSFDTAFGNGTGKKMITFGVPSTGSAMGIENDGKAIVAGIEDQSGSGGSSQQLLVFRERIPGGYDPKFATAGIFHLPATGDQTGNPGALTLMANQPVIGYYDGDGVAKVIRLKPSNGAIDTKFGTGGIVDLGSKPAQSAPSRLIYAPDSNGDSTIVGLSWGPTARATSSA